MPRWRLLESVLALALALAVTIVGSAPARAAKPPRRVPYGFVGMMADGPVYPDVNGDLAQQMQVMVASGVESLRVVFDWAQIEPRQGVYDWVQTDEVVGLAAQYRIKLLPIVVNAPSWDARPEPPGAADALPKSDGPYGAFLTALIGRYGPHGSYWAESSYYLPVRMWQVWNEPNLELFWPQRPFVKSYVPLLRVAHDAIKRADPGAKVVLGGLTNFSWDGLIGIYKARGARRLFDIVAVHPYTKEPAGVITILRLVRGVMDANGDRHKPMIADEVSWPSSAGHTTYTYDWATTERGQARDLAQLFPLLAQYRSSLGLIGFYWYTWAGYEYNGGGPFEYAGLFRYSSGDYIAKPAFNVFRADALALEGCRKKGPVATECVKPG